MGLDASGFFMSEKLGWSDAEQVLLPKFTNTEFCALILWVQKIKTTARSRLEENINFIF
jgi:hypothetical protein